MIGFYWARLRRDDAALQRYSLPEAEIMDRLSGKSVAIVGNARALARTNQGDQIDAADIVIRINSAPMPGPASHGAKTDWLAMSTPVSDEIIALRNPSVLLWMTRKRKRLPWRIANDPRFFLNPARNGLILRAELGASGTTGAMVIELCTRSKARSITLYGFDFFASKSLSGRREAAQVPHDFNAEKDWVTQRMAQDTRLKIVPPVG